LFAIGLNSSIKGEAALTKPNVVFILVDDMGYGDIGSYGAPDIRTPHLDRLAREGGALDEQLLCRTRLHPTRAASGREIPWRVRLERAVEWTTRNQVATTETSIARMLKNNGYAMHYSANGISGSPDFGPNAHGFDEFFGFAKVIWIITHRNFDGGPDLGFSSWNSRAT
jgi:arylsulfatase